MRSVRLCAFVVILALASGLAGANTPQAVFDERDHAALEVMAEERGGPWTEPLMPMFEEAAARHDVPLPLLLTLAYFGSAFENRGDAPTIEGGYGVMALRENWLGANSLGEGEALTRVPKGRLKVHAWSNINAAAAVLSAYAHQMGVDRSKGLQAWLDPVIKYAGLEEEWSRFFAMEIFEKLLRGLDWTNSSGEYFEFPPQDISGIDLSDLEPKSARRVHLGALSEQSSSSEADEIGIQSADHLRAIRDPADEIGIMTAQYPPATWYGAASCNYTATSTWKDTVIIHTIEGTAAGCLSWFQNCDAQVSSHYVVSEAGGVWQCVDEWYIAWHVGCYNSRSLGIEHEGYAGSPSHPQSLYDASALLTRDMCNSWGIPKEKRTVGPGILGHIDVTNCCCGTHWDPGSGWDWNYFIAVVNGTTGWNPPYLFDGGSDGWSPGNGCSAIWWIAPPDWGGAMYFDQLGNDCFVYSPTTNISGPWAPQVVNVDFYAQSGNTGAHDLQLFWKTNAENFWDAPKSTPIVNYNAWNSWATVNLYVNNAKWWGQTINQLRLDFDNTNHGNRWIVNHFVLQDAFWWHFDSADNVMGWTAGNALTAPWQTSCCGWPGILVTDQTGNDAYMFSPVISGDGWPFNYLGGVNDWIHVRVYPQSGNSSVHDMAVYWIHGGDGVWNDAKSTHVTYTGEDQWVDVYLPVGLNPNWPASHITRLRLDFDQANHGNRWLVDYISSEHFGADSQAPGVPTNLSATATSETQVNLTWTASTDNVGVNGYEVYRNNVQIGTSVAASYSDTTCSPGTSYTYEVSAYDATGNASGRSTAATVTTPGGDTQAPSVPTGLSATAISGTQINLSWIASTDNVGVSGYKVFRNGGYLTSVGDTSYSDVGCSPNSSYTYEVSAYDAMGNESARSAPAYASTPPSEIIIDNPACEFTGVWATGTSAADKYGADYHYASTAVTEGKTAIWRPNFGFGGNYDVYCWYPQGANRSAQAPYTVYWSGGSQTVAVNQQTNGGQWNLLVSGKTFALGTSGYVKLGNGTGETSLMVMADAVRFVTISVDTVPPTVPTNLTANAVSETQVDLSWTASTDNVAVGGYNIYRNSVKIGSAGTTGYSDTTCSPDTSYTYEVSAYDTAGNESAKSSPASATTPADTTAPSVPTNLSANAVSGTQIDLSWTASTDNVGVTGYKIYRNSVQIDTSATTSYSDTTCSAGTTYTYEVSAYDAAGNESAKSDPASATTPGGDTTPPTVPTDLSATAVSGTQVDLSWTASTDDVGVTGYKIYRDSVQIDTSATTSYSDTTCSEATTYTYEVSAYDAAGNESAKSAPASATTPDETAPSVPTNLSANAVSGTQIDLSWTASTDNVGVTGYKIYRNSVQIDTSATTSYSDTTCSEATTYTYEVSAYDAAGNESAKSSPASATTPDETAPSVPTDLTANAVSGTQIDLSWTASTDNVGVTGYKIYRDSVQIDTSATTLYSDTTCSEVTTYTYEVSAYDAAGNESAKSSPASATTPDETAPSVPTNLSANAVSGTQIDLSWTASTDNVGVTGYRIYRDSVEIGTSATTSYSDTTCSEATTYTYEVSAYDAAGNESAKSSPATATTPDTIAPTVPTNLSANAVSTNQIDLAWTASTDNVGVTGYKIYRDSVQIDTSATTSYSDTTCSEVTTYTYEVSAYDAAGNESAKSAPASATTPDETAPSVPTNLSANAVSGTQIDLSWTASTDNVGVTGYKIYRNSVQIDTSATTSYSDTTCSEATTYTYEVSAYDAAGNESAKSSPATATTPDTIAPTVPTNLSANAVSTNQIDLAWTASTDNVGVTGYKIYRNSVQIDTSATTSYSDTTCSSNTTYTYEVSAYDAAGNESAKSSPAVETTPPRTDIVVDNAEAEFFGATWFTGTSSTDKYGSDYRYASTGPSETKWATWTPTIDVAGYYDVYCWYPQGSNRSAMAPYTVYWDGGSQTVQVNQQANGGQWNTLVATKKFAAGTSGYVKLGNGTGETSLAVMADAVRFLLISDDLTPPTVPTNLSANAVSATRVDLTWTASTDNVGVTGYKIYRDSVEIGTSATTSYSDTTCSELTTYTYEVSAYDAMGNESDKSSPATATTLDGTPPSVPTNLAATAAAPTKVSLSWTASTDNVGVTGYKVYRDSVQIGTSATTSYSDTSCSPSRSYTYEVSAYDAVGNESAKSSPASATTPAFAEIIIDNPQAAYTGVWSVGTYSSDKYGSDYHWASTAVTEGKTATWTPTIQYSGYYDVYCWYPQGSNRANDAPYTIQWDGGSQTVEVNQQASGGQWNLLVSSKHFAEGTAGYVKLGNGTGYTGKVVIADAVRFQQVGGD